MSLVNALFGGVLIGLASALLLFSLGRIAGISGIVSGFFSEANDRLWRVGFVLGLVLGGAAAMSLFGVVVTPNLSPLYSQAVAGLLVGFGTVIGAGCTSGHGICGLARFSKRSMVSVVVFIAVGVLTATLATWLEGGVA